MQVHEVPAVEPLDLSRGREETGAADGTVALQALAQTRVISLRRGYARVARHAVEKVLHATYTRHMKQVRFDRTTYGGTQRDYEDRGKVRQTGQDGRRRACPSLYSER